MEKFKAYRIHEVDKKVSARFEDMTESELDTGDVVIRVAYSSINYKDALAATGAGRVIRRFPCIGGIDMSGTVVESGDARFRKGDEANVKDSEETLDASPSPHTPLFPRSRTGSSSSKKAAGAAAASAGRRTDEPADPSPSAGAISVQVHEGAETRHRTRSGGSFGDKEKLELTD